MMVSWCRSSKITEDMAVAMLKQMDASPLRIRRAAELKVYPIYHSFLKNRSSNIFALDFLSFSGYHRGMPTLAKRSHGGFAS